MFRLLRDMDIDLNGICDLDDVPVAAKCGGGAPDSPTNRGDGRHHLHPRLLGMWRMVVDPQRHVVPTIT